MNIKDLNVRFSVKEEKELARIQRLFIQCGGHSTIIGLSSQLLFTCNIAISNGVLFIPPITNKLDYPSITYKELELLLKNEVKRLQLNNLKFKFIIPIEQNIKTFIELMKLKGFMSTSEEELIAKNNRLYSIQKSNNYDIKAFKNIDKYLNCEFPEKSFKNVMKLISQLENIIPCPFEDKELVLYRKNDYHKWLLGAFNKKFYNNYLDGFMVNEKHVFQIMNYKYNNEFLHTTKYSNDYYQRINGKFERIKNEL